MNGHEVAAADVPARYLAGDLSDAEREAYEQHYFECDACFRELEVLRTTQAVLAKDSPATGPIQKYVPRWLPIAAAVMAATTLAVWWSSDRGPAPDQADFRPRSPGPSDAPSPPTVGEARAAELVQMARFEAPRYEPPRLRGGASDRSAAFDRAMAHYRRGEFAAAVPGIEEHLRGKRDDIGAAFFLGVSLLATGEAEAAIRQLERVLAAGDSATYEEEALYLLAKAHIKRGDLRMAIAALDRTIALDGERADDARTLRERLAALEQQKQ